MMINPFDKGTGAGVINSLNLLHSVGIPICKGGSQSLPDALEKYIIDNGGTIRKGVDVKSVKVVGGEARAFVLADGEEIEGTKGLFSTFHVKQLFGDDGMVDGSLLDAGFRKQINNLRASDYMALNQHIVLSERPIYTLHPEPAPIVEQGHGALHFRQFFNGMTEGKPSPDDSGFLVVPSIVDPSRCPNGEETLVLYSFEPWDLYGDAKNWDKFGQEIADRKLESFFKLAPNLSRDKILNRWIHTPLDYSREKPSWLHGDFCHISQHMDQSLGVRPTAGLARYKTPIDKLYIGGCCTHPGPTVTGGGRAQVQVIFEDLGINFDDVVRG
jgi:phytoene dehydrogenase-like protein